MAEANSYEEQRRRQIEANKRKLHELGVHKLSAGVRQAAAKPMRTKLLIPRNPRLDAPSRRSRRIASLPAPEQPDTDEERAYAITKAQELKDQLGSDHPTFIKRLHHLYATRLTELPIPMHFRQYLPVHDEMMVWVDEMNNEFAVLYSCKLGSRFGRWRAFAAEHKLADDDCLVFQLIESRKFKVYIVRASSYRTRCNEMAKLPNPAKVYATDEERAYAISKAEELKDQLGSDHPTFIRPMSHDSATKSNHLWITMLFTQYLPVHDEMMVLVDEMNNEFDVLYSCKLDGHYRKPRLSRWRGFAAQHKLADGDCLVFQLIERRKLKVYIVRASSYNRNDH